ncbi:MAG: hypothetical protein Ct9H300mP32_5060 [Verrucomicrobiota bacterium]|nr:MAG: hypothetical protein Ct9H300mP32_5060 [Verrucomicrobiota bacterium]
MPSMPRAPLVFYSCRTHPGHHAWPSEGFLYSYWTKHHANKHFWAEGGAAGDFNRDGHSDLVVGPYWYAGPDYGKRHEIYPAIESFEMKGADGNSVKLPGFPARSVDATDTRRTSCVSFTISTATSGMMFWCWAFPARNRRGTKTRRANRDTGRSAPLWPLPTTSRRTSPTSPATASRRSFATRKVLHLRRAELESPGSAVDSSPRYAQGYLAALHARHGGGRCQRRRTP